MLKKEKLKNTYDFLKIRLGEYSHFVKFHIGILLRVIPSDFYSV